MQTKTCNKCNEEKTIDNFAKQKDGKFGVRGDCKICRNKQMKKYQSCPTVKAAKQKYKKQYYKENREKIIKQVVEDKRQRLKNDPVYRTLHRQRSRIWDALKRNIKSSSTMELVGCSIDKLKQHLESKFTEGMSWDNYGEWHVDHIKPCSSFDLTQPDQQRQCFNYKNLQPLWAADNLSKGDSY